METVSYLRKRVSKHGWELAGMAVLFFIVLMNIFPAGYIIDSGDVVQFLSLKDHYVDKVFYDGWMLGRMSIFYAIFYLLDLFGVSDTGQLSWYLGLFLLGSYVSFRIFCRSILPGIAKPVAVLVSLFYAANIYTLYVFTSTWGFTSYQVLYVFIPALTGLYMQSLWSESKKPILWFLVAVCIASMSFSNPAFAVSSAIYFFLLTIGLFLSRLVRPVKVVWLRIAIMAIGAVLLNMYWILPLIPKAGAGIESLSSSDVLVLPETLRKTSNAIFDSIRLMQTSEQEKYYPANFPYPELDWMKPIVAVLAFAPFFIILFGLFQQRLGREKKVYAVFFGLFIVFILLVARVRFPFTILNDFLFQLPGMNALRGWDKLAIFTPFVMSALLLMALSRIGAGWRRAGALTMFALLAITLALPFYFSGIQTRMSHMLAREGSKDYRSADYSALVKIPQPYLDVARIFDNDRSEGKISMLPYSPGSSVGKVSFPAWKVNGPSVARVLYERQYVELSEEYVPGWIFAEDFDDTSRDPRWITDLFGLIGVKYIMYHKDAKSDRIKEMEVSRKYLEESTMLELVTENDSFRLYRIKEECVFPYIYAGVGKVSFAEKSLGLSGKIAEFRGTMKKLSYERMGVQSFAVDASGLKRDQSIFLNEKYDPLWRAEYTDAAYDRTALVRDESVKYANAWKVDGERDSAKIEIYYWPFRLLFIGMWISGAALVGLVGFTLLNSFKYFHKKDD